LRLIAEAALVAGVAAIAAGPATAAAATISTNWSGYVAHRGGVKFRSAAATWTEPAPACGTPFSSYSSAWVGLGGFRSTSSALEQIGVELDCRAGGGPRMFAWYELVPAPAMRIGMPVGPGDTIKASVTVIGRAAALKLTDTTRRETFSRTIKTPAVDVTSADWIVEAPSACFRNNYCRTLPLANFGTVSFAGAAATTTTRHQGPIASPRWTATKIALLPSRANYVFFGSAAGATPSALSSGGSAFAVTSSPAGGTAGTAAKAADASASVSPDQPGGPSH
jgi:Peptidase A4 family